MKFLTGFIVFICMAACTRPMLREGDALLVNGGDNTWQVLDLARLEVKQTGEFRAEPGYFAHHVSLSENNSFLAVAFPQYDFTAGHEGLHNESVPGKVAVSKVNRKPAFRWLNVPHANFNAVISPDETELWTAGYNHSGRVYVYDLATGEMLQSIIVEADPSELVFSRDGRYLAVACGESSFVTVIDAKTRKKIKDIKVDPNPFAVWPGYESLVFVSNELRKSLNIIDLEKQKVVDYIDFGFIPGFITYNAGTQEIWVLAKNEPQITFFKKAGNGKWDKTGEYRAEAPFYRVAFSDNGRTALCISTETNNVTVLRTMTKEQVKIIKTGQKPNGIVVWEKEQNPGKNE